MLHLVKSPTVTVATSGLGGGVEDPDNVRCPLEKVFPQENKNNDGREVANDLLNHRFAKAHVFALEYAGDQRVTDVAAFGPKGTGSQAHAGSNVR